MHPRTELILKNIGLSPRETRAVAKAPIHDIEDRPKGYGLLGDPGIGKTWHLARRIGLQVEDRVESSAHPETAKMPNNFARWRNWPDAAEMLKLWVANGYSNDIADLVEQLSTCRELYLDDVGQERIVGPDDYSLGFLRTILDARYRANLPVFWSSNLDLIGLNKLYGGRTISRIVDAWPPVTLQGPDNRMSAVSA